MSAIPRPLARRIDRLARGAHAFHRFAHHPLCAEYEGEVFRLGRRARLCRGCALAAAGIVAGALLGILGGFGSATAALALAAGVLAAAIAPRRTGKIVTRFVPCASAGFAVVVGVSARTAGGFAVALAAVLLVAVFVAAYRRRGPNRTPCSTCPEREGAVPCRGFTSIVRREQAFQRRSAGWLARDPA